MRRLLGLLALVTALLAPSGAAALDVTGTAARLPQLQIWADNSRLPLPSTSVSVFDAPCPAFDNSYTSCTYGKTGEIYLWTSARRNTWMHEVWHVVEAQQFTDADREAAAALMGLEGQPWRSYPSTHPTDPTECFAQVAAELSIFRRARLRFYRHQPCIETGLENRRRLRQLIRRAL